MTQWVKNPPVMWEIFPGLGRWRRERLPTSVFWPGEFHGLYSPWGHREPDKTERFSLTLMAVQKRLIPTQEQTVPEQGCCENEH